MSEKPLRETELGLMGNQNRSDAVQQTRTYSSSVLTGQGTWMDLLRCIEIIVDMRGGPMHFGSPRTT